MELLQTFFVADKALSSDWIVSPYNKVDDVPGDTLLLGFELGNDGETNRNGGARSAATISSSTSDGSKTIHKRDQSSSNTAWFGPRLGRRKRSLRTNDLRQDDDSRGGF